MKIIIFLKKKAPYFFSPIIHIKKYQFERFCITYILYTCTLKKIHVKPPFLVSYELLLRVIVDIIKYINTHWGWIKIWKYHQNIKILKSLTIKISKYENIEIPKYQNIDMKMSKYQNIEISKYGYIKISKYQNIDIWKYQFIKINIQIPKYWNMEIWNIGMSKYQNVEIPKLKYRNIQNIEISKYRNIKILK